MIYLPVLPLIAKYPFLRITGRFLEYEYGSLEKIFCNEKAVEFALRRIEDVIEKKITDFPFNFEDLDWPMMCFSCDRDCVDCSFLKNLNFRCNACGNCFENCYKSSTLYSKFKVWAKFSAVYYLSLKAIMNNLSPWLRRKIAINEARRYRFWLEKEIENKRYDVLNYIMSDLNILAKDNKVHVSSYLRGAVKIRDEKWRLLNRVVCGGWVELTEKEIVRLMEEVIRDKIEKSISIPLPSNILDRVNKIISKSEIDKIDINLPVDLNCFPPCMKKILSDLQNGVNIPHTARFALTSFLLNVGMSVEDIVKLFSSAPDFDEEKTRYQVEHIAGLRGKGSEYMCPSCETMKTYHNCIADCNVSNPLVYYTRKVRNKKSRRFK